MGGLGNQLFQYATAKSLALAKNSDLMMDISYFKTQDAKLIDHVRYKLDKFNISSTNILEDNEIQKYNDVTVIHEPLSSDNFSKFMDLKKYNGNINLKGYWQNEKYFSDNAEIIKKELTVKSPPNSKNRKILNEIKSTHSVCISFRRGEYLDSYFKAQFGICCENYYKRAINIITKNVDNPVFYLFSDDMEWIENNVDLDYPTVPVNINPVGYEHEELRLMSNCKHFIITNSSFSWWGAWLSQNKNKIVLAPTPWFNSFTKQDILCQDWIHLKTDMSYLFNRSDEKIFELNNKIDIEKIEYSGLKKAVGNYGTKLDVDKPESYIKLKLNTDNTSEYCIELKLYSEEKSLIKIDYGKTRKITLGYEKGYSTKYLLLADMNLNNVTFAFNDSTLSIENITIKKVKTEFNLEYKLNKTILNK